MAKMKYFSSEDLAVRVINGVEALLSPGEELSDKKGSFISSFLNDSIAAHDEILAQMLYTKRESNIYSSKDVNTLLQDLRGDELDGIFALPAVGNFILAVDYDELERYAIDTTSTLKEIHIGANSTFLYRKVPYILPADIKFKLNSVDPSPDSVNVQYAQTDYRFPIPYDNNIINNTVLDDDGKMMIVARVKGVQAKRKRMRLYFTNPTQQINLTYGDRLIGFKIWSVRNGVNYNFEYSPQVRNSVDFSYRINLNTKTIRLLPTSNCKAQIGEELIIEVHTSLGSIDTLTVDRAKISEDLGFNIISGNVEKVQDVAKVLNVRTNILDEGIENGRNMASLDDIKEVIYNRSSSKTILYSDADIIAKAEEYGVNCKLFMKNFHIVYFIYKKFVTEEFPALTTMGDIVIDKTDRYYNMIVPDKDDDKGEGLNSIVISPYEILIRREGQYRIATDLEKHNRDISVIRDIYNTNGTSDLFVLPYFLRITTGKFGVGTYYDLYLEEPLAPRNVYNNSNTTSQLLIVDAVISRDEDDRLEVERADGDISIIEYYAIDMEIRAPKSIVRAAKKHIGIPLVDIPEDDRLLAIDIRLHYGDPDKVKTDNLSNNKKIDNQYVLSPDKIMITGANPINNSVYVTAMMYTRNDISAYSEIGITKESVLDDPDINTFKSDNMKKTLFIQQVKPRIICMAKNTIPGSTDTVSPYDLQRSLINADYEVLSVYDCKEVEIINSVPMADVVVDTYRGPVKDKAGNVKYGSSIYKCQMVNLVEFVSQYYNSDMIKQKVEKMESVSEALTSVTMHTDFKIAFDNTIPNNVSIEGKRDGIIVLDHGITSNSLALELDIRINDTLDNNATEATKQSITRDIVKYFVENDIYELEFHKLNRHLFNNFSKILEYLVITKVNGASVVGLQSISTGSENSRPFILKHQIKDDADGVEKYPDITISVLNSQHNNN